MSRSAEPPSASEGNLYTGWARWYRLPAVPAARDWNGIYEIKTKSRRETVVQGDLLKKAEELISELDAFEGELRDCLHAVASYRVRIREIQGLYGPLEHGGDLFDEVDSFLARKQ